MHTKIASEGLEASMSDAVEADGDVDDRLAFVFVSLVTVKL